MKNLRKQASLVSRLATLALAITGACRSAPVEQASPDPQAAVGNGHGDSAPKPSAQAAAASTRAITPPTSTTLNAVSAPASANPVAAKATEVVPGQSANQSANQNANQNAPTEADGEVDEKVVDLTLQRMFSPKLFKLSPAKAEAYFTGVATLQLRESDESWSRSFAGPSHSPWMAGMSLVLERDEPAAAWRLGQAVVAWNPPKDRARALYDRLVAQVQAIRHREPDFGGEESDSHEALRGWSWCGDRCQAHVQLDNTGKAAGGMSLPVAEGQPVVVLTVFTPEGP